MIFDIILQAKKLVFDFAVIEILFWYTKINYFQQILVWSRAGAEPEPKFRSKGAGV